ncbi:MAG: proton-conducting transporter membrane subunit [Phycisphaerae bacterium]|nr:proton-conducting transporter membrane subunit [Phycisphaerae bacterium]
MLSWFILAPLAGLVALNLPLAAPLRKRAFSLAVLFALAQAAIVLAVPARSWAPSTGVLAQIRLNLHMDNLVVVLMLSISIALFAAALVGRAMIAAERARGNFVSLLLVSLTGMNGAVLVTDLFSLYVFLEVVSVSSFILIAFNRDRGGLEGAFKYLILSAVATAMMLSGVALLMMVTGSTTFVEVRKALADQGGFARLAIAAFACGLFIKAGLVPFHGWVLGAYSAAPAAASVLLAGIVTKVSGLYALFRLTTDVFPPTHGLGQVLLLVGAASIIVGALAALGQKDMKRMLAFSSISQMGYVVLALGCAVAARAANMDSAVVGLALVGAAFHLFNHAVFKSLLFVNSAALEMQIGTTDMARMGGLGGRMPITGTTSCIAALSTAGIPPFSGFWSKIIIVVALWKAGFEAYAMIAVALSLLTLAYFLVLQRRVFFGKLLDGLGEVTEAGWEMRVSSIILAAVTTGVGLLCLAVPPVLHAFVAQAAEMLK